jgi:hypothetical protein
MGRVFRLSGGCSKGENSDVACPFNGDRHLSLMLCAVPRDPSRNNFPPFRDEISKDLWVFIIDIQFLIRTESADLSPHERFFLPVGSCSFWGSLHSILLVSLTFAVGSSLRPPEGLSRSLPCESDSSLQVFASVVD